MILDRVPGCTTERVGDRVLVLDPDANHLTTLNAVGSLVWEAIDGPCDLDDLVAEVTRRLAPPVPDAATIRADVEQFATTLLEHGLVVRVDAPG